MPHTYAQNIIHVVFGTKGRSKSIPREFQVRLWPYVVGICKNHGILVQAIGGMDDHLHCLIQLPASLPLAEAVIAIKSNSSRWARTEGHKFSWQEGYGAFSVSASVLPSVVRYIKNQEAHHRKMSFEEEFLALLQKHGVKFDAKFVLG